MRKQMLIRKYKGTDLKQMIDIWNDIVEAGIAFPQEELLDEQTGEVFFSSQITKLLWCRC